MTIEELAKWNQRRIMRALRSTRVVQLGSNQQEIVDKNQLPFKGVDICAWENLSRMPRLDSLLKWVAALGMYLEVRPRNDLRINDMSDLVSYCTACGHDMRAHGIDISCGITCEHCTDKSNICEPFFYGNTEGEIASVQTK